jgi:putative ABC transport system permease protein
MPLFAKARSLLRNLLSSRRVETDLDREIRSHLEMLTEENLRAGMGPDEAQRAARIELGGIAQVKENVREERIGNWLHSVLSDCRFDLRQLRKSPAFTAVAVLTLGLGIGANTALFSVINAVLLRPLPFYAPDRLVAVGSVVLNRASEGGETSYPVFLDWRAQSHSFESLSVWNILDLEYTSARQPESVRGAVVSANLLSTLGVSPVLGRLFVAGEDQPGTAQNPVILSYEFWQSDLGGDPRVLGQALTLEDAKYHVIAVMPAGFQFPIQTDRVELWITIAHDFQGKYAVAKQRGAAYLQVLGRMKPGVTLDQAQSDLLLVQTRLNQQYPENRPRGVRIRSEADQIAGEMRPPLLILLGAVAFVLLIACANVASLLLARATVREKEFTIRFSLGASRSAIIRQLLVESTLLALFGGTAGILIAQWATRALLSVSPVDLARSSEVHLDLRVLAFTFLVALATGVLFGLAPAVQASRLARKHPLALEIRSSSTGSQSVRLRSALVVCQLAIAFVLLIGAGLLLRSFSYLLHVDPGFRPDHVLTFLLDVSSDRYVDAKRAQFVERLLESTRALPGVTSASAIFGLPLSDGQSAVTSLEIEGKPQSPSERPRVGFRVIESQYFRTMGIRLLKGRTFTADDERGSIPLAIVNQTFVRQILDGKSPLGLRIKPGISFGDANESPLREIVGVTADVMSGAIGHEPLPEVYIPQTPTDFVGQMTVVVRTATDPNSMIPAMRSLVTSMDRQLPIRDVKTLDEYVSGSISAQRFEALLLLTFSGLAFVLTAIGLYGVVSYAVAQRTHEIGIRLALGAEQKSISLMVLRRGASLTLTGIAIGLGISLVAVQLIRALLYGIQPIDAATFIAVPLLLSAVASFACYIPARRASRVDPMVALRHE